MLLQGHEGSTEGTSGEAIAATGAVGSGNPHAAKKKSVIHAVNAIQNLVC